MKENVCYTYNSDKHVRCQVHLVITDKKSPPRYIKKSTNRRSRQKWTFLRFSVVGAGVLMCSAALRPCISTACTAVRCTCLLHCGHAGPQSVKPSGIISTGSQFPPTSHARCSLRQPWRHHVTTSSRVLATMWGFVIICIHNVELVLCHFEFADGLNSLFK